MKLGFKRSEICRMVAVGIGCLFGPLLTSAATLSITPAVVDNTYSGSITLNITGLTNGEQVAIQKFLDSNANGAVDAGEAMMDVFKITDGGANKIGGIANMNAAFDSNSATGAITAVLNIAPPRSLGNVVGQLIYRLSSPSGNFPATNATFTVTNAALGQTVSGAVYSNGVAPVPYAFVVVMVPDGRDGAEYFGSVVADASGHYELSLAPGYYMLMPTLPGYFTDQSVAAQVPLAAGISSTNNLFLTNGTVTISGNVHDAGSGTNLGGVLMPLEGANNNLFAIAFTDTNGDFSAPVGSGVWKVKPEGSQVAERGYLVLQNSLRVDTTTGSVANVSIALPKGNAMFYGTLTNTSGAALVNIGFSAQDNVGQYDASGVTDENGKYCVAVLAGTNFWQVAPDSSHPPLNAYILSGNVNTNLGTNQAFLFNFTATPASNHISGFVKYSNNQPVTNLNVSAWATINGVDFGANASTDGNGAYSLNVANGTWHVNVDCGSLGSQYSCPGQITTNVLNGDVVVNIVISNLKITTTNLPAGTNGVVYSQQLNAGGGQPPYTWSLSPGITNLSNGLTLATNGVLSGTLTGFDWIGFGVRVTDSQGATADQPLSLYINPPPLRVTTTSLPAGTNGQYYDQVLQATGGVPPYSWYLPNGSVTLPAGLNLNTNGAIFGTPTTNGTFNFQVAVYVSSSGQAATQSLSLTLAAAAVPPLTVTTTSPLPSATQSNYYSTYLSATGGQPPYTWSLAPGSASLPPNLSLQTNGILSGFPQSLGTYPFFVRVTDARSTNVDWFLSLTVNPIPGPVVMLTAPSLPGPGQFQFGFSTSTGTNYTIQYSSDLHTWNSILTFSGSGMPITVVDPNANVGQRFYRVKVGP